MTSPARMAPIILSDAEARRASELQRAGQTFTEISIHLGVSRTAVITELYWDRVRDK